MRRAPFISALLAVAFVVTSCTALYYPGDDYFDATDAAAEAGSPTDGAVVSDAPALDADASLVCPPNSFCDDFERSDLGNNVWMVNGAVAIDKTHAHSPTRSMSAVIQKGVSPPMIGQAADGIAVVTRFELWFLSPTAAPRGKNGFRFRIAQFLWGDDCDWDLTWELQINADDGLTLGAATYDKTMNASCGPIDYELSPSLLTPDELFTSAWHHVSITSDVSEQVRRIQVSADGKPVIDVQANSSQKRIPTFASSAIGLPCVRYNGGCLDTDYDGPDYEVWVDDLIVTAVE